ncbi:MAG: fumarylacetoacetate hydrolase, partial [Gammaproteobacteria bacterium]|nr:fumarylacetoacetate hydrolase [Gammaproteobacteria bacterium]
MTLLFDSVVIPEVAIQDSDLRFPVRRIYCVGQNYRDHVKEMGGDPKSSAPVFFSKPADAVVPSGSRIAYPSATGNLHYEVELVVALKSGGSELNAHRALECIYGYAVGIDFTRRDLQAQA